MSIIRSPILEDITIQKLGFCISEPDIIKCVGQEDEDVEVPATRQKLLVHVFRDYRFGGNIGGNSIQVAKTTLVKTETITTAWDNLCSCNAPEGGIFVEADNTGAAPSQN